MTYVDGFVLVVPKKKLAKYKKMAELGKKIWLKHGAIDYKECVGDDLKAKKGMGISFLKMAKAKPGETIVFAYIVYKSKAQRDSINKKVMSDPAMQEMDMTDVPFDMKRFSMGGFRTLVEK
jgi:alkaline phosphatase